MNPIQYRPTIRLQHYAPRAQIAAIVQGLRGEEAEGFRQIIAQAEARIADTPPLYAQDGKGDSATVHLHYFTGSADWFITELDPEEKIAFGLCDLFQDGGELGYVSTDEITAAGAELDLHFTPRTLAEVKAGREAFTPTAC